MRRPTAYPSMTAEQFRDALARVGWTQIEFATRAGLTPTTVNRWANGSAPPPPWAGAWLEALIDLAALHRKHLGPRSGNE